MIVYFSRIDFLLSIIGVYFFIKFLYYFGENNIKKENIFLDFLYYSFLTGLYIFSDKIISGVFYDSNISVYSEKYGDFILAHYLLTIILFIFIIFTFLFKLKKLTYINRIRLKNIFYGFIFFLFSCLVFLVLLPYFGIYLFQKEIILFMFPFIVLSWHTLSKYHFSDLVLRYNEMISFFSSLIITLIFIFYRSNISIDNLYKQNNLWGISSNLTYIDIIFSIIIFFIIYKFFINTLPFNKEYKIFLNHISRMKSNIPFLINFDSFREYVYNYIKNNFKIYYFDLILDIKNKQELYNYFNSNKKNDLFINDVVFLQENKKYFSIEKIKNELHRDSYIIFPIRNNFGKIIGFFELGKKPFKEHYYTDEINIIKDFVNFVSGHLKYIDIYSKINYLSFNLDKEVDKKTIEYNNLINRQKEFISVASHEIKTPIMSAGLQVETIIDDINDGENNLSYIKSELDILKGQIFHIIDLVKVLFNSDKIDYGKTTLYIEKIKLKSIFLNQIDIFKKNNTNLEMIFEYDERIDYIDLDKIQFTQVISNLLTNAIKFCNHENPKIYIEVSLSKGFISIIIEDNGNGFKLGEEKYVFDKYKTGKGNSIGLGLGLYLCKKIIELHNGTIKASNSKKLSGAKFSINIPKYQNKED
ncbi:MAG: HAMP domain-containing sensor histidine kinase [Candidatus Gracilibacteria bacterium]|nr:HAMP domain-containing sensor histidine kinase [Candidatus Gracilibacteria bacterium]